MKNGATAAEFGARRQAEPLGSLKVELRINQLVLLHLFVVARELLVGELFPRVHRITLPIPTLPPGPTVATWRQVDR